MLLSDMVVMIVQSFRPLTIVEVLDSVDVHLRRLMNDPHDCLLIAFFINSPIISVAYPASQPFYGFVGLLFCWFVVLPTNG